MARFLRNSFGHGLRLCPILPKDNDTGVRPVVSGLPCGSGTPGQISGSKAWYAGRRNKKHAPCPSVLTHQISPCNRSLNSLATAKP